MLSIFSGRTSRRGFSAFRRVRILGVLLSGWPTLALAQTAVTREAAIASAREKNPRATLAAADIAIADAAVRAARQFENPVLGVAFSKDAPQQHYSVDIPFDPWTRSPRIAAATAARDAVLLRAQISRRSITLDIDTAYTRAQLSRVRSALSSRSARAADSLLVLARVRRDAGDASDLDVELAVVFAGQSRNVASTDSLDALTTALTVQALMGIAADSAAVTASDSLTLDETPASATSTAVTPLVLSAATKELDAADLRIRSETRNRFGAPSVSLGFETGNPDGPGGALPTFGFSLPLPFLNRNGAAIASARAERTRAQATLALARLETGAAVVSARRDAEASRIRARRSETLVASAERIANMSLLAYREGASTVLVVLEAQRTARETLLQYFEDVAASRIANSVLRMLTTPAEPNP